MTETAKTWHKRVARWKASVRANTLLWWSSKLKREAAASSESVRMVQLVRAPSSSRGSGVIVDLPDVRARVMVEPGFDRETLGVVLDVLQRERA
jgi:hypothetical protein